MAFHLDISRIPQSSDQIGLTAASQRCVEKNSNVVASSLLDDDDDEVEDAEEKVGIEEIRNVAVYSQATLEKGILAQVDEAVHEQNEKERQEVFESRAEELLKKIEKLKKARSLLPGQEEERLQAEKELENLLCQGPSAISLSSHLLKPFARTVLLSDVLKGSNDCTNSDFIRLGEATPFDFLSYQTRSNNQSTKSSSVAAANFGDTDSSISQNPVKPFAESAGQLRKRRDSDEEEYEPSSSDYSDTELPSSSKHQDPYNIKRRLPNFSKKSFTSEGKTEDDGSDKVFERRIKAWRRKKLELQLEADGNPDSEDAHELDGGLKISCGIWDKLYKYQQTGVRWLWELHSQSVGGIMGDEMGLGKTVQVIAFLSGLANSKLLASGFNLRGLGPVLIVCPTTVMQQWVTEFHRWWPEFRVAIFHSTGSYKGKKSRLVTKLMNVAREHGRPTVLITSYSTLNRDREILLNKQNTWHYVILDEGHKIKNPDGQVTLTAKSFRTPHRLILTGSPMQNSLKELWSLFDFVYPGKLGTLPVFMEEFSVPITQGGYANASQIQVQTAYKCACVLRDTVSPYLLRRMKKDVNMSLQLPSKSEQVLFCMITEEQRRLYKEYLGSRECEKILSGGIEAFVGLILLRKLCNHPDLVTGGPNRLGDQDESRDETLTYGHWCRSGKMAVVRSLLKLWQSQGHKVLLFSQSRQMLIILEKFVKKEGYSYLRMDGSTGIGSRQGIVQRFNSDQGIFLFLLTTRVGGLGVNLTGANRVLIFDPDWNPSTDMQARERAWRIGQDRPVTIYRLLTSGTIEEKIYHRQIFKQFLTNRILSDPRQRRFFKTNDLHELFTLTDDRDFSKSQKTETAALFAGTGSEVKLEKKKRKIAESDNFFDKLAEEKRRKTEGTPEEKDEEDIDFVPAPAQTKLTEKRVEELKKLAKILSKQLAAGKTERPKKKRRKKEVLFEGKERIPYLAKQETLKSKEPTEDVSLEKASKQQDDYVLEKLFKKSGVHTALRHDNIVASSHPDFALVEGEAEKVAKNAAKAISESRKICRQSTDISNPTWTGRFGAAGKTKLRFGNAAAQNEKSLLSQAPENPDDSGRLFGGKRLLSTSDLTKSSKADKDQLFSFTQIKRSSSTPSGLHTKQTQSSGVSSSDLLASIEARKLRENTPPDVESDDEEESRDGAIRMPNDKKLICGLTENRYGRLADEIRAFVALRDGKVTTEEVLQRFGKEVARQDSTVFKAILKKLCVFYRSFDTKEGTWRLKDEFF